MMLLLSFSNKRQLYKGAAVFTSGLSYRAADVCMNTGIEKVEEEERIERLISVIFDPSLPPSYFLALTSIVLF